MELNKCNRCGNFYVSNNVVCPKCITKDNLELSTLKNYLQENGTDDSIDTISSATGITQKNLNRFMSYDDIKNLS